MSPESGKGLRRTSSLVLDSPTKNNTPGKRPGRLAVELVIDRNAGKGKRILSDEIIDLSSSSEEDTKDSHSPTERQVLVKIGTMLVDKKSDPFLGPAKKIVGTSPIATDGIVEDSEIESEGPDAQPYVLSKTNILRKRRTVVFDSESEGETNTLGIEKPQTEVIDSNDDDAILIFNDPPTSCRPVVRDDASPSKSTTKKPRDLLHVRSTPSGGRVVTADPSPLQTPVLSRLDGVPGTQAKLPDFFTIGGRSQGRLDKAKTGTTAMKTTTRVQTGSPTKRKTKKMLQQEKQAYLEAYAQSLFEELNASVFKNRLPSGTPLVWNKRLLATAGRAKWHRDSKGVETTCIELATKVLDCEERIRNTLSHEMCHLACWAINCNPKENHGRVWQGWVDEVMEKRPDIAISMKHSYDIAYKYEWQCQTPTCKKIYGRHSNSIDPSKSICGVCKVGDLVPLFKTRARKTKAAGKLASDKLLDSPMVTSPDPSGIATPTPSRLNSVHGVDVTLITDDSGSEHEALSDADTENEDFIAVSPPKGSSLAIIKAKASGAGNSEKDGCTCAEDVRKLVTHMSIIDLTND